ncbi:hypothetical protein ACQ1Q5_00305 [Ornithobacterium rhinotracheale]
MRKEFIRLRNFITIYIDNKVNTPRKKSNFFQLIKVSIILFTISLILQFVHVVGSAYYKPSDAITNDVVTEKVQIGISNEVILAFLDTQDNVSFDLENSDIMNLQKAGVSPKIISKMIEKRYNFFKMQILIYLINLLSNISLWVGIYFFAFAFISIKDFKETTKQINNKSEIVLK